MFTLFNDRHHTFQYLLFRQKILLSGSKTNKLTLHHFVNSPLPYLQIKHKILLSVHMYIMKYSSVWETLVRKCELSDSFNQALKTRVDFNKIFKIEMFSIPEVSYHWGSVKLTPMLEQRTEPFVKSFKWAFNKSWERIEVLSRWEVHRKLSDINSWEWRRKHVWGGNKRHHFRLLTT